MKTAVAVTFALAFTLPLAAKDPEPAAVTETWEPNQVRLDLLIVSVPEARALELRAKLQNPAKIAAAQEKLLALVASKKAKLIGWPTITTKSGQRCVVETTQTLRFPVEYRFEMPIPLSSGGGGAGSPRLRPEVPKLPKIEPDGTPRNTADIMFDQTDLGVTLEVEPTIGSDGMTVDMQLAPQHHHLLGFRKVPFEQNNGKIKLVVEQPDIARYMSTMNITVKSGVPVMLGFHKVQKPVGNVEIFILETTVEKILRQRPASPVEGRQR